MESTVVVAKGELTLSFTGLEKYGEIGVYNRSNG